VGIQKEIWGRTFIFECRRDLRSAVLRAGKNPAKGGEGEETNRNVFSGKKKKIGSRALLITEGLGREHSPDDDFFQFDQKKGEKFRECPALKSFSPFRGEYLK